MKLQKGLFYFVIIQHLDRIDFWTGLTFCKQEGVWRFKSDDGSEPQYTNFDHNEPDDHGDANCVM